MENQLNKSNKSILINKRQLKLKKESNGELHTVIEEESDSDGERAQVTGFDEAKNFIYDIIEGDLIFEMILTHTDKFILIQNFLYSLCLRRKYLKLKKSTIVI